MSLTSRLSWFLLAALAFVLAGFSTALFLLARGQLDRQLDDQLRSVLNVLTAVAEVESDGVEWETHERRLDAGGRFLDSAVIWVVQDDRGILIDHSPDLPADSPLRAPMLDSNSRQGTLGPIYLGEDLRVWKRKIDGPGGGQPSGDPRKHGALVLVVAASVKPIDFLLERLLAALGAISAAVCLAAVLAGRWYCRRALRPVRQLTEQAVAMNGDDRAARLEVTPTGDELQSLGNSINGLLQRLHESGERQRRFTGDASHQLRTPLAALLGQVEIALRHPRSPDEYRQTLAQVREQGIQLRRIIEMLLFLARADADAAIEELTPLDLAQWLPEHLRNWSTHPRYRDLQLVVESPLTQQVKVHPPLLGQLLDNLLDNALKYSEPGTPVVVRAGSEGDRVLLSVEDCGIGVASGDRLFEPFFRSERARKFRSDGIGLGLSVAQRICRLFRGTISAARRPDGGSCFTVQFPATRA